MWSTYIDRCVQTRARDLRKESIHQRRWPSQAAHAHSEEMVRGKIPREGNRSCREKWGGVRGSDDERIRDRRRGVAVASADEAGTAREALAAVRMVVEQNGIKDRGQRKRWKKKD